MKVEKITIKEPVVSYPDVDMDFGENFDTGVNKDDIVQYIIDKYGRDYVAYVGNRLIYYGKSAMRDLANVYDISSMETYAATKEYNNNLTVEENMKISKTIREYFERHPELADKIDKLSGTISALGVHAGGVIISNKEKGYSLREWCALQRPKEDGKIATLWTKNEIEQLGFIKYDILGLSSASQIHHAQQLIGLPIYKDFPEDIDVFRDVVLNKKHKNIFQFETYLGKQAFEDLKPMSIMELANASGLIRVLGSVGGRELYNSYKNNIDYFQQGEENHWKEQLRDQIIEDKNYDVAKEVLKESYGVLIYQEQLSYLIVKFSNGHKTFTDGNKARKLLDKHGDKFGRLSDIQGNKEVLKKWHAEFMKILDEYVLPYIGEDGINNPDQDVQDFFNFKLTAENNLPTPKTGIIAWMISSAAYLFSKLHAIVYSVNTYNMMYLKYYYPLEFWTSSLICEQNDLSKIKSYITAIQMEDCGIEILSPSVNESNKEFTMSIGEETDNIRYGIGAILSLGKSADVIINNRNKNGKYLSIEDFLERVSGRIVNKTVINNLLYTNAFSEFGDIETIYNKIIDYGKKLDELITDDEDLSRKEMKLLGVNLKYLHPLLKSAQYYKAVPDMYDGETAQVAVQILKTYNKVTRHKKPYVMGRVQCLQSQEEINVFDWANGAAFKMNEGDMAILNIKKDGNFYSMIMSKKGKRW